MELHLTKSVSCTVCLPIEFHGFTSRINSKSYHSLVPGLISFFTDGMVPLKTQLNWYLKVALEILVWITVFTFHCFSQILLLNLSAELSLELSLVNADLGCSDIIINNQKDGVSN